MESSEKIVETPLGENEIFEIEVGKVNQEQNIESIKVEEYEAPKAMPIPKGYMPINRKKFDDFFKRIKHGFDKKEPEVLDAIIPEKEQFQARGIGITQEKKYQIVREHKVK